MQRKVWKTEKRYKALRILLSRIFMATISALHSRYFLPSLFPPQKMSSIQVGLRFAMFNVCLSIKVGWRKGIVISSIDTRFMSLQFEHKIYFGTSTFCSVFIQLKTKTGSNYSAWFHESHSSKNSFPSDECNLLKALFPSTPM